jgi:hypothetical protein
VIGRCQHHLAERDDQRLAGLIFDLTWRRRSNAIRSTSTATARYSSALLIATGQSSFRAVCAPRSLAQSTFRGGFAQSGFVGQRSGGQHRSFGSVLGFVGPLFWPYAYNDFVDYTFSPYAYDTFWPYAYDDLFQGIYGNYAPGYYANEDAYAYAGAPASGETYADATGTSRQRGRRAASTAGTTLICSGQAEGLTAFPIEQIAQQVELDLRQRSGAIPPAIPR